MRSGIKAIALDLDDTLWPIDVVMERAENALHQWFECHAPGVARELPPSAFAEFRRALALELPSLAHDFTALRREALRRALRNHHGDETLAEAAMETFLAARNRVEFYPDALQALTRLAARFPLVSLSNGNADLGQIGIGHYFQAIVSARSVGYAKPDARIFRAACVELGLEPGEILHVGDDPDLDVRGGAGAGWPTVWLNRGGKSWVGEPVATHEVPDLLALCEWLGA
jgi:2-haloalkanoic acid dehalogenase type II